MLLVTIASALLCAVSWNHPCCKNPSEACQQQQDFQTTIVTIQPCQLLPHLVTQVICMTSDKAVTRSWWSSVRHVCKVEMFRTSLRYHCYGELYTRFLRSCCHGWPIYDNVRQLANGYVAWQRDWALYQRDWTAFAFGSPGFLNQADGRRLKWYSDSSDEKVRFIVPWQNSHLKGCNLRKERDVTCICYLQALWINAALYIKQLSFVCVFFLC